MNDIKPPLNSSGDNWAVWSNYVLISLRTLSENQSLLERKLDEFNAEISILKVKSGVWGLMGGALASMGIIVPIILFILKMK